MLHHVWINGSIVIVETKFHYSIIAHLQNYLMFSALLKIWRFVQSCMTVPSKFLNNDALLCLCFAALHLLTFRKTTVSVFIILLSDKLTQGTRTIELHCLLAGRFFSSTFYCLHLGCKHKRGEVLPEPVSNMPIEMENKY